MKIKGKNAISLIVLVITVIILSILAATVIISVSNTDIIDETSKTVFKSDMSTYKEMYETYVITKKMKNTAFDREELNLTYQDNEFSDIFTSVPDKYKEGLKIVDGELVYETENETENEILKELGMKPLEKISTTTSYVGYYVDVDGDSLPDGVIYKDMLSKGTISSAKDYYIIKESYAGDFGTKAVLQAKGSGESRFYVLALEDFNSGKTYIWYDKEDDYTGDDDFSKLASGDGKTNTENMIAAWKAGTFGPR